MEIGKLNRRVEILEFKVERDAYGGADGVWLVAESLWASICPVSGTEYFSMQQIDAQTVVTITVRYNPRITVMHRVRYGSKIYEIIGVGDENANHEVTVLNCKEMVNDELQRKAKEGQSIR